jgi:predicted trehalose synthase
MPAGKQHRFPFPKQASHCATRLLERIHSDLHEVSVLTTSGYRYWLTFIDDLSHFGCIA